MVGATFVPFHCCIVFHCMTIPQITPSVIGHLGASQFAFMNNAAMNILLFPVEYL